MKKIFLLLCLALAVLFVSCKSTEQTTENSLVDTSNLTEQTAEDEGSSSEDENANADENAEDAGSVDNTSGLDAAESSRQAALDAGAKDEYATAFAANDAALAAIKALNDGKDHSAELADIKARYDALAAAAKARKLKERIDSEGLASNSQSDYDNGVKALDEFDSMLALVATPGATLNKKAAESYDSFHNVWFKSYKKFANDERKKAIEQKKACDAVRAQVARKAEYSEYADLIKSGDSSFATQNPEAAYNSYRSATEKFEALAKDVAEKRAAAQKAIEDAKAKIAATEEYAEQADSEKPLGDESVAGIEAEDTVLLEKDEFADPDDSVIQIDENVQAVEEN